VKIIPPLTQEEYSLLEESIKKGYNTAYPIIVCDGTIIDGHNRYELCKKYNIAFTTSVESTAKCRVKSNATIQNNSILEDGRDTSEMSFDGELDIKIWIIQNQFARRNLTPGNRCELAFVLEPMLNKKGKENQAKNFESFEQLSSKSTPISQNSAKLVTKTRPVDTREEIAKLAGVSHDTVSKYKQIREKSPEETFKKGELPAIEMAGILLHSSDYCPQVHKLDPVFHR